MMELPFKFTEEDMKLLRDQKNEQTIQRRVRTITGVGKMGIFALLDDRAVPLDRCQFCGSIKKFNFKYMLNKDTVSITNMRYSIKGAICGRNDTEATKKCIQKGLNPNSIEYVKMSYGFFSKEEANQYILERNSSPFYRTNYDSDEEYQRQ